MLSHSTTRFFFGPCRQLAPCLVLLILPVLAFCATERMNLPQSKDQVVLPESSRQALVNTLEGGSYTLDRASSASFMAGLPPSFRDSCGQVSQNFGDEGRKSAQWTVRVLVALRTPQGNQALVALRCGLNADDAPYDERPALVTLSGDSTTLRFIPLAEECKTCLEQFYHVEFSQILPVKGALLLELKVSDLHNPCCDGGDTEDKDLRVLLSVPEGQQVLALEELSEETSEDDSADDAGEDLVCHSKIDYSRDGAGNLESINTATQCTESNKPLPDVTERTFRWNADARRFDAQGTKVSKVLPH